MTSSKSNVFSRRHLVPALIVFTICYQLVYNIILFSAVQEDASRDECSALAGVGNADTPHCLEVRLFRSWHEAELNDPEDNAGMLQFSAKGDTESNDEDKNDKIGPQGSSITVVVANHMTHLGHQLDTGDQADQKASELSKQHDARVQERQAIMDRLETSIRASLNNNTDVTPWAKDLMAVQNHLESEMHSHVESHHRRAAIKSIERAVQSSLNSSSIAPWAEDLVMLRDHLEHEVNASEARADKHAKRVEARANLTTEIAERMTNLENRLSHLALQRKAWEGKLLSKYGVPARSTTSSPKTFLDKRLQWSDVQAWSKSSWRPAPSWPSSMSARATVVLRKDVRHMHWSGAIPSVACIAGILGSRHTSARMMYFINNFRLQDYEGPRQLVLVYHHADADAKEIVRAYSDGAYIKGLAVHGDEAFPSSAAFRFGAWSSQADVIARWDFDEWHDPSRLSMQIRAMAMSSRPACILKQPLCEKNDTIKHASGASSLLGERLWMDKHWRPFLKEETSALETSQAARVVQLDMQAERLSNHISHVGRGFEEPNKQEKGEVHAQEPHSWNMSECLEFDTSDRLTANGAHIQRSFGDNIGHDMSKQFRQLMMRHHDISQKLQLLCLESVLEGDEQKQVFMRKHVDQMASVRVELDKHIGAMMAVFVAP